MPELPELEIARELGGRERLLWSGQPRAGMCLTSGDIFLIPFSVMWGGFAIFWEWSVIKDGGPGFFALWGIPFVVMGLYLIAGRFFADAYHRGRTVYGLTDRRILIVNGLFGRQVQSLDLATLGGITVTEGRDRSGTIAFGPYSNNMPSWMAGTWPGTRRYAPPRFEQLDDVRSVYEQIQQAQRQARVVGG